MTPPATEPQAEAPTGIDSSFLKTLLGYNARRAAVAIMALFDERMAALGLKPVEFSVLCLIGRNPGVTPSQLCAELALLPPHLTKMLTRLDKSGLLTRHVLASDKRAVSLGLSASGVAFLAQAEATVAQLEADAASALTAKQQKTLIELLQKIY
ncbi:MAG: MarR family transcriptional regulator [Burkholderiaceae bacterium]|jgi:DNA-binding MarR family transcriptional regulator